MGLSKYTVIKWDIKISRGEKVAVGTLLVLGIIIRFYSTLFNIEACRISSDEKNKTLNSDEYYYYVIQKNMFQDVVPESPHVRSPANTKAFVEPETPIKPIDAPPVNPVISKAKIEDHIALPDPEIQHIKPIKLVDTVKLDTVMYRPKIVITKRP